MQWGKQHALSPQGCDTVWPRSLLGSPWLAVCTRSPSPAVGGHTPHAGLRGLHCHGLQGLLQLLHQGVVQMLPVGTDTLANDHARQLLYLQVRGIDGRSDPR